MPLVATHDLQPGKVPHQGQVYNTLDCCLTLEIMEALRTLHNEDPIIYNFERALQAPVLEMMLRGFKVDEYERRKGVDYLRGKLLRLNYILTRYAVTVWGKPLNPGSPKQMLDFFYGAMKLPEIWISQKGVRKLSLNREVLEKLEVYFYARPIIAVILEIREISKQLEVLETEIDPDGRLRTSYNIAGTETGRFSSSSSSTGTGRNIQNIDPLLRKVFVADPGWKLCGIDLEQAESREVGWLHGTLFGDWRYLDACEHGDLHTTTCKLIWPKLPWTGDPKKDREIAEQSFYRHYSYRDMSKRGGHGCLIAGHEVLTPTGWVQISTKPKTILTWSEFGSSFQEVSNWIDKPYWGEFTSIEGTSIDLVATGDHRVLFYKDVRGKISECPASELPLRGFVPLGGNYVGGSAGPSPDEARLIAAYQCDGHQKSTNRVEFHFHKERKFQRLEELAKAARIPFERRGPKAFLFAKGWQKAAGSYLLFWSPKALDAYLHEHKYWDGHISTTAVSIFSKDPFHLEWLQTLGRIRGIGGNFQKETISGFGTTMFRLQQNNRQFASISSLKKVINFEASAQVYCPTVSSGAFYIRRNGKISITGNSNYYGTPFTMARHLKVPTKLMDDFQDAYFEAYPAHPKWHRWTAQEIQTKGFLTTPFGRTRHFFGRTGDDTTLREAIAYIPQSSTADRMNLGLWRIWKHMPQVQLLAQVHDAVYFQYRQNQEHEVVTEALERIRVELKHGERSMVIPGEAKIGWNWGGFATQADVEKGRALSPNPDGLIKYKGPSLDTRVRTDIRSRPL